MKYGWDGIDRTISQRIAFGPSKFCHDGVSRIVEINAEGASPDLRSALAEIANLCPEYEVRNFARGREGVLANAAGGRRWRRFLRNRVASRPEPAK
jgi:hypothetical protein